MRKSLKISGIIILSVLVTTLSGCSCSKTTKTYLMQNCDMSKPEARAFYKADKSVAARHEADKTCPVIEVTTAELAEKIEEMQQSTNAELAHLAQQIQNIIDNKSATEEEIAKIRDSLNKMKDNQSAKDSQLADVLRDFADTLAK
jgi:septal ring factor EnvC (AmiA/AmiB activator)